MIYMSKFILMTVVISLASAAYETSFSKAFSNFFGVVSRTYLISVTDDTHFRGLTRDENKSVVIYFCANSCDKCNQMTPIVKKLAKTNKKILFLKVDKELCPSTVTDYQIGSVPEFVFRKKKYEVDRYKGNEEQELETFIKQNDIMHTARDPQMFQQVEMVKCVANTNDYQKQLLGANDKLVVILMSTDWCSSWNSMLEFVRDQSNTFSDVLFLIIDIEKNPIMGLSYRVKVLPTFIFQKRDREFEVFEGAHETSVHDRIAKYLNAPVEPENIKSVTDMTDLKNQLDRAVNPNDVLVSFCLEPCDPCKIRLRKNALKYSDILFLKVDLSTLPDIMTEYTIKQFPTFIFRDKKGNSTRFVEDENSNLENFIKGQLLKNKSYQQ